MKSAVLAVAAALATSVLAQPHRHQHEKHHLKPRAPVVIVTEYDVITTTIGVTTTIWVNAGEEPTPPVASPPPSSSSLAPSPSSSATQIAAQFFQPLAKASSPTTLVSVTPPSTSSPVAPVAPTSNPVPPPPPQSSTSSSAPSIASVSPVQAAPAYAAQVASPAPQQVATTTTPVAAPATPSSDAYHGSSSSSGALAGNRGGSTVSGGVCSESSPCHGKATFYDTDGYGSCGNQIDGRTVPIVALAQNFMQKKDGGNPNNNPYCNKGVTLSYNGKTVHAYVFDKCPGCSDNSVDDKAIDLSHAAFDALAAEDLGHVQIDWWFN